MNNLARLLRLKRALSPLAAAFERYCPVGSDVHHVVARIGDYEITSGCLQAVDSLYQHILWQMVQEGRSDDEAA